MKAFEDEKLRKKHGIRSKFVIDPPPGKRLYMLASDGAPLYANEDSSLFDYRKGVENVAKEKETS